MEAPLAGGIIQFIKQFKTLASSFLEACENNKKLAKNLYLNWGEMNHIMANAVKRGLERQKI